jgi:hypothetical protein
MDADGGVEAEAAAGLPGEHVLDGVLVEQAAALEEAEHAALQRALEAEDVVGSEMGRLVEGDAAVVALGEDAVEDDDVEVEVGIEGGAEAVQEGDGAELGVAGADGLARRSVVRMARSRTRSTSPARRGSWGRKGRIRFGREKTHWRTGSGGRTWSVRWAATSTMRRALQEGQTPRPLQEKATRRSAAHASQRMRAKPWARMPQRR